MSASTEKKLRQAAKENGTDTKAAAAKAQAEKKARSNRRVTFAAIVLVILLVLVLYVNSGLFCRQATAITVGDAKYSVADVNYAYGNQYYYYANSYGLGQNMPRSTFLSQSFSGDQTWKDFLVDTAAQTFAQNEALCAYAEENGIALTQDDLAAVDAEIASISEFAKSNGALSASAYLANAYGKGVNTDVLADAMKKSALAQKAYNHMSDSIQYSDKELEDKYATYEGSYDVYDFVSYLVPAEKVDSTTADGTATEAPTEETLAAAKEKADAIVAAFAEAKGKDSLEKLSAAVDSVIPGESAKTGLLNPSGMDAYKEWMTDSSRKAGDIFSVQNNAADGYYVVVYGSHDDNHYPTAAFRHILVKAEADENGAYTDEAKAAAKAKAEEIYAEFKSGDMSEDSFAALAEKYSEDPGSATNGGLYENVAKHQMVDEVNDFCFGGHKSGDTGIVYGETGSYCGYHVMYYVGEGEQYSSLIARSDLLNADLTAKVTELVDAEPIAYKFWMRFVA